MSLVRRIGKWSLTALVVNAIVGSGIFGQPAEMVQLLGRASVVGVLAGGLATAIVIACFAEVASKIPEPGGSYIYARTVFGRFAGIQVGWFSWLTRLTSAAASATLFVSYLGGLVPWLEHGVARAAVLTVVLGILTGANYVGVSSGARLSAVVAVAKLAPLLALGFYGIFYSAANPTWVVAPAEIGAPGLRNWFEALLLLSFLYGGCDTAMMPMGEVENPKRTAPFALAAGLIICMIVFTSVQIAVLATIGGQATTRPLADAASVFFGRTGAVLTSIAAMVSTYGFLAASTLSVPRLTYSLAQEGDFPRFFARVHERFRTPFVSILLFGSITWLIAVTGSFRIAAVLSIGARLVTYVGTCGALIPLRRYHPERKGLEIPLGPLWSVLAVAMSLALITRIHMREAIALAITAGIATVNWWWVAKARPQRVSASAPEPSGE